MMILTYLHSVENNLNLPLFYLCLIKYFVMKSKELKITIHNIIIQIVYRKRFHFVQEIQFV